MQFTAEQIAKLAKGTVEGDPGMTITSFGKIEEARTGQLTFFGNPKYEDYLYSTNASIVIISERYVLKEKIKPTLIRVSDVYSGFAILLERYQQMITQQKPGVQQPVYIAPSASIGENVFLGAFAYLGEKVKVGNNTKI